MRNKFVHGEVFLAEGRPQVALCQTRKVTTVLFNQRFIQVVSRAQIGFDLGWQGALTVKGAARRQAKQNEDQRDDDQKGQANGGQSVDDQAHA